jgi:hypothetical protein
MTQDVFSNIPHIRITVPVCCVVVVCEVKFLEMPQGERDLKGACLSLAEKPAMTSTGKSGFWFTGVGG